MAKMADYIRELPSVLKGEKDGRVSAALAVILKSEDVLYHWG